MLTDETVKILCSPRRFALMIVLLSRADHVLKKEKKDNLNIFYRLYSITARSVDRLDNAGIPPEARANRAVHHADARSHAHPLQRRNEKTKAKHSRAGVVQHCGDAGRRGHRLRRENVEHIPDTPAPVSTAERVRRGAAAKVVVPGGHRLESQLLPRRRLRVQLE